MSLISYNRDPRSFAEFSAFVAGKPADERWELIDGVITMQASPSALHQRIVRNLLSTLHTAARRRSPGCEALPGITVKVANVDTYAPIPDVLVRCGPPLPPAANSCADPILVVEVSSPSTARHDRVFKAMFYEAVPSIETYLVVFTDECRVEVSTRDQDVFVTTAVSGSEGIVRLPGLDVDLSLDAVYEGTGLTR